MFCAPAFADDDDDEEDEELGGNPSGGFCVEG